jgi:glutathione synthase/RimK-type ligase-like ATP-grasp enzyme
MNFLIVTEPDDIHAIYITMVLESLNHQVINLFSADFPSKQKNSVFIDSLAYHSKTEDDRQVLQHLGYDVVWWRRPRQPYIISKDVSALDVKFHQRESNLFHDNFTHQLAPGAWWINRKEAALRANYKLLQLKIAGDVGLTIPTTLCSNHPQEIMDFFKRHHHQGVIYKPLSYQAWQEQDGLKVCYTAKINDIQTLEQVNLSQVPGIFQEEIPKALELRITCFGDYIVAAKIDALGTAEGRMDWRSVNGKGLKVEPYILPDNLKRKICFFMRELGIAFGCIDMIVTPEGEYVFLEVNEQGQFLFLEQLCPDLPMLDIFIQFLSQQSLNFHWVKHQRLWKMEDFQSGIEARYRYNLTHHLNPRQLESI